MGWRRPELSSDAEELMDKLNLADHIAFL